MTANDNEKIGLIGQEPEGPGAFVVVDEKKLSPKGLKLVGGMEALMAMVAMLEGLRAKSQDPIERTFLSEVAQLAMQGVQAHQNKLGALAMESGAGEMLDVPEDQKPN